MGDIVGPPTTLKVDVGRMGICVAEGVSIGSKVAVTKSGVAVNVLSLTIFTPQPVHTTVMKKRREMDLRYTSLLYPRTRLRVVT